jgi:DNA invertase Pin-like site-specific DNA recombinase
LEQLKEEHVLVVWKLDRLSRSLKDLLQIMEQVHDAGAGFRSVTEAVDTTTSAGLMVMQMLGSFAERAYRSRRSIAISRTRSLRIREGF